MGVDTCIKVYCDLLAEKIFPKDKRVPAANKTESRCCSRMPWFDTKILETALQVVIERELKSKGAPAAALRQHRAIGES